MLLPIILIGLEYKGLSLQYEALVDSGADMNLFPWEIANGFGFEKKDAKRTALIHGISGEPLQAYFFDVVISVGGSVRHTTACAFSEHLPGENLGFLGQRGFFDYYRIEFDYAKKGITLWNNS